MGFYNSGISRLVQRSRAGKITCGARCLGSITGLYTSWINSTGKYTGANSVTGPANTGAGQGGTKTGVN